jgi:hypothetical protein
MNHIYQIDYDKLKQYADRIERGTATLNRLSLAEEIGRLSGGRSNVEASLVLGHSTANQCVATRAGSSSTGKADQHDDRTKQEYLLEQWARHEGIFEDWDVATKRIPYDLTGTEAKVYQGNTDDTVIKITYPYIFSNTPIEFLDNRVALHNYLFPDTAYKLLGITRKGKAISFILEQPRINEPAWHMDFSNPQQMEHYTSELDKYGFNMLKHDPTVIYNADYVVKDLHEDNILIDECGNLFFIDTVPVLNTAKEGFGGTRKYGNGNIIALQGQL